MAKKMSNGNMPQTEQCKEEQPGLDTSPANAYARCTEHDLRPEYSRTRMFVCDEQTFCADKPGNRVTERKNY